MKLNKYIYACLAGVILLTSCNEQENKVKYSGPAEVSFKTVEGSSIFGEAPVAGVDKTYNLNVVVTTPSDKDRNVVVEVVPPANYKGMYDATVDYLKGDIMLLPSNITYIANSAIPAGTAVVFGRIGATWSKAGVAIEGHHYNLVKTVKIKSGQLVGPIVVTPIFANLVSDFLELNIKIKSATEMAVATYRTTLTSKLIKFIPWDEAKVLGKYTVTASTPYEVEVVKAKTEGEYLLKGEAKTGDIRFKFVYDNPSDFHTIVLNKKEEGVIWYNHSKYGDIMINGSGKKGAFSMADPSFTLIFDGVVDAGVFRDNEVNCVHK